MVFYVFLLCYAGMVCAATATHAHDDHLYCTMRYRRLCQGKGQHIACQFPTPGPGDDCRNYTEVKFTSEEQHFITNYINRRRQKLAAGHEKVRGGVTLPRPQIMMHVEWDRELAMLAQRLADQCYFVHDDCRATVRYPYAGQTVGEVRLRRSGDSTALDARRAIRRVLDAWWGERRRVDPKQMTQPFRITAKGSVWGHFSQLAVWSLRAVGCGAARHGDNYQSLLLVCDFSHTNMLGQRTITPGNLAPCPQNTRRRSHSAYPLLCAAVRGHNAKAEEVTEDYQYQYDEETSPEPHITRRFSKYDSGDGRNRNGPIEVTTATPTTSVDYIEDISEKSPAVMDFTPAANSFYNKLALRLKTKKSDVKTNEDRDIPNKRGKVGKWKNVDVPTEQTEITDIRIENTVRPAGSMRFQSRSRAPSKRTEVIGSSQPKKLYFKTTDELTPAETVHRTTTSYMANSELQKGRHKWQWKQMRQRPERPGAAALLHAKPLALTETTMRRRSTSVTAFVMDEEDVMQLFRDTGFHSSWRKSKS